MAQQRDQGKKASGTRRALTPKPPPPELPQGEVYTKVWGQILSKIKLPTGVVGKLCYALIAFVIAVSIIVWAARTETAAIVGIIVTGFVVLVLGLAVMYFAHKHPQAALLEGEQWLTHEQIQQLGMKARPVLPFNPTDYTSEPPRLSSLPEVREELEEPASPEIVQLTAIEAATTGESLPTPSRQSTPTAAPGVAPPTGPGQNTPAADVVPHEQGPQGQEVTNV